MAPMKHVGRIVNTGRRCVVVFREIYDERGHVIDEDNCLVFDSDSLPDAEHQDLMRILESHNAQTTPDLYNVLARERLGNGLPALTWLVKSNRLRKIATDNIELTPDSRTAIKLNTINKIVKMQKTGASRADIENVLRDDTDLPPRDANVVSKTLVEENTAVDVNPVAADAQSGNHVVLDDAALAKSYIEQAKILETQAKELRSQAKDLMPTKKNGTTKEPANNKA